MVEVDSIFLLRMRGQALRKGIWFNVLESTERAILSLVPRCMEKPRSPKLAGILAKIIAKINDALKSRIAVLTNQVGKPLAEKLSRIAHKWGHKTAYEWVNDQGFSMYLAIVDMNNISLARAMRNRLTRPLQKMARDNLG